MRSVLLFLVSFVCYAALGQRSLYASDGFFLLESLGTGSYANTSHEGYLPILHAFAWLVGWAGLAPVRVVTLLSALGTAVGVVCTDAALRRLLVDRVQRATAAAVLAGAAPAVVFFATVVEYHGCFFAFSQFAFLSCVLFLHRPTLGRAAVFGGALTAAGLVHSTGLFLPLLLLPFAHVLARPAARTLPLLLCAAGGLLGTVCVVVVLRGAGVAMTPPIGVSTLVENTAELAGRLVHVPGSLLREWLIPFLPVSVVVVGLAASPRATAARRMARAAVLSAAAYAVPTALILEGQLWERGAYLLPAIGPLVAACALALRPRWLWILAAASAIAAVAQVRLHERLFQEYRQVVDGALTASGDARPLLLVAEPVERGACVVLGDRLDHLHLFALPFVTPEIERAAAAGFATWVAAEIDGGRQPLVSRRALAVLESGGPSKVAVARVLAAACRLEEVECTGFAGYLLRPRS